MLEIKTFIEFIKQYKRELYFMFAILACLLIVQQTASRAGYNTGVVQTRSECQATIMQCQDNFTRAMDIIDPSFEMLKLDLDQIETEYDTAIEYWQGAYYLCDKELTNKQESNEPQKSQED